MPDGRVEAFPEIAESAFHQAGEKATDLEPVQEFLSRFGYLREGSYATGVLDDETSTALAEYQTRNAVPVSGNFDETTANAMTTSRCGLPDLDNGIDFSIRCNWNTRGLTFAFDTGTADIAGNGEFDAIRRALRSWTAATQIVFTEVGVGNNPDIRIGWRPANDPDHSMVGGILAHADFPLDCGVITNTRPKPVHFDDTEHNWSVGAVANSFDVETVGLHELGHILGLQHSTVNGSVMFPSVSANFTLRVLQPDDRAGIEALYPRPAAVTAWGPNRLDIFGLGTDRGMFHKAWTGNAWAPSPDGWEGLGGIFTSPPAVTSWGNNRLDIFGLGLGGGMFHKAWTGSAWTPGWEALGGIFTSPPAVTSWGPNRLDIFGLGTDGGVFHKAWTGNSWTPGWEALGGIFTSPPAVTSWGPNRLDIFGLGLDGGMYHKAWTGNSWTNGWESLGGVFTSPPAVTSWGNNRLDIFGLGLGGGMFHKAWTGNSWTNGWESLGGVFTSPPAVTSWGPNRLDIFGLGTDRAMYHKAWTGSGWSPSPTDWERLGGVFTSPPAVESWGLNRLDIFGLGTDKAMYHKAWTGTKWAPSPNDWERLGGIFS
ncbi:matrixin family metalloprotease [Actinoplanes bogorensis]|uniref:Matrixin family metalloprotease n=1 Tax=Paractinoplanes bogorensis TaxID=1610840 RepID=A0ABS5YT48_9ACTN|nr:matrixin family metalloprotease [Actinoplanes bogorensis]MBU2666629.1 matrixin family metalloprotease [Actinoplanes bogorensis]